MSIPHCPGSFGIKGTPTLTIKICPDCGGEVELFSSDSKAVCSQCGFIVYNDAQTCIQWCRYARECIGDEVYERFHNKKSDL